MGIADTVSGIFSKATGFLKDDEGNWKIGGIVGAIAGLALGNGSGNLLGPVIGGLIGFFGGNALQNVIKHRSDGPDAAQANGPSVGAQMGEGLGLGKSVLPPDKSVSVDIPSPPNTPKASNQTAAANVR